jgi:ubiquitin carboxyl-terminal hydrolase 5/13
VRQLPAAFPLPQDPKLAEHLAHFGINMMMMEKTEKTMAELELEQNIKHEWSLIQESGADLKKVRAVY